MMKSYKHLPAAFKGSSCPISLSYDEIKNWCDFNFGFGLYKMAVHEVVNAFCDDFGGFRRSEYYALCDYLDSLGVCRW